MKKILLTILLTFIGSSFYVFAEGVEDSNLKSFASEEIPSEFKELIDKKNTIESSDTKLAEPLLIDEAKKFGEKRLETEKSVDTSSITYPLTKNEIIEVWLIFAILLALNFSFHIIYPKLKGFVIATPFNLGGKKNEGSQWKRGSLEFTLLLTLTFSYYVFLSIKKTNEVNYLNTAENCLLIFFILQFIYIFIRFLIGFKTSCPACKVTFARKSLGATEVALNTYKELSLTQPADKSQPRNYIVMETGTVNENYSCISCGNEWVKTSSYRRRIGSA